MAAPSREGAVDAAELARILAQYQDTEGALMPALHEVQSRYGWISPQAIDIVAQVLRLSPADVYATATFYHEFRTQPPGKTVVSVCRGPACRIAGAMELVAALERELAVAAAHTTPDGEFTLETYGCLGICGHPLAAVIGHEMVGRLTPEAALQLIRERRAK